MLIYNFHDPSSEFSINYVLQSQKSSGNNKRESLRELGYPQKQQQHRNLFIPGLQTRGAMVPHWILCIYPWHDVDYRCLFLQPDKTVDKTSREEGVSMQLFCIQINTKAEIPCYEKYCGFTIKFSHASKLYISKDNFPNIWPTSYLFVIGLLALN